MRGRTVPHERRDFPEWHGGIRRYGFWAVLPGRPDWIRRFEAGAAQVRPFVIPGNRRRPHVTVLAAGLLSPRRFSQGLLRAQTEALEGARLRFFPLRLGGLESFASAPYLRVEDPEGALPRIRRLLARVSPEDAPYGYVPHLTVGLYAGAFSRTEVSRVLRAFRGPPAGTLLVRELAFCAYDTRRIQGAFRVLRRVALGHGLCGKGSRPPGTRGPSGRK